MKSQLKALFPHFNRFLYQMFCYLHTAAIHIQIRKLPFQTKQSHVIWRSSSFERSLHLKVYYNSSIRHENSTQPKMGIIWRKRGTPKTPNKLCLILIYNSYKILNFYLILNKNKRGNPCKSGRISCLFTSCNPHW